jgi:hypothetical protein
MKFFTEHKKPLPLIVIGSNAQLLPPPISDAFDSVTAPFPVRPGGARAPSVTSSGPFNPFRHPSARRLVTRHSRLTPPSTFKVSFLPNPLSTFSVGSLPIPRSASDCRRPDAMGRNRRLRVPPSRCHTLPPCSTLSCCPDELRRRMCLCHSRHRPRAVVHGAHRERFAAHEDCVGLVVPGGGELAGRNGRKKREQERRSGGCATGPLSARNDDLGRNQLP